MAWEEFTFALAFLTKDDRLTVDVGLQHFLGAHVNDWGGLVAASTVTLPVVVVFLLAQRRLGAGLVSGAVK